MASSSTFSEWAFCGEGHWPENIGNNAVLMPLNGLLNANDTYVTNDSTARDPSWHGYAASLYFRSFLSPSSTNLSYFARLWTALSNGTAPVAAIAAAAQDPLFNLSWDSFTTSLYTGGLKDWNTSLSGELVAQDVAAALPGAKWKVDTVDAGFIEHTFTEIFFPLSARLFVIDIKCNPQDLLTAAQNRFQILAHNLGPSMKVSIYKLEYSGSATYTASPLGGILSNLNDTVCDITIQTLGAGAKLLLVVENSDGITGVKTDPVEVRLECKFGPYPLLRQLQSCNRAYIYVKSGEFTVYMGVYGDIIWSGPQFSSSDGYYNVSAEGTETTFTENLLGSVDPACGHLSYTDHQATTSHNPGPGYYDHSWTKTITITGLPFLAFNSSYYRYIAYDAAAKATITAYNANNNGFETTLDDFLENNYISTVEVYFYKQ